MTPWEEFMTGMRPEIHQSFESGTEEVSEEARKKFEMIERQQKLLQETQVETFTNPEGAAYADITPAYGMSHRMGIHDAIEKLEGEEAATAEMMNESADIHMNMEENAESTDTLDQFMETVKSKHLTNGSSHTLSNLDSKNPITHQANSEIDSVMNKSAEMNQMMESSQRTENTQESMIFNNLIENSKVISEKFNIPQSKFIEQMNQISSTSITEMTNFYIELANSSKKAEMKQGIAEQGWYQSIKNSFPNVNMGDIVNNTFTIINNVTHIANPIGSEVVSKVPLPPNTVGIVSSENQNSQFIPAKPGNTVINEVTAAGANPTITTGQQTQGSNPLVPNPMIPTLQNPVSVPTFTGPTIKTRPTSPVFNPPTSSGSSPLSTPGNNNTGINNNTGKSSPITVTIKNSNLTLG